ncbi:MAG: hypothetical protein LBS99_02535, partial [Clostridiales bacterium]|nr:hypothetical protein [Clostridiales bacterium]
MARKWKPKPGSATSGQFDGFRELFGDLKTVRIRRVRDAVSLIIFLAAVLISGGLLVDAVISTVRSSGALAGAATGVGLSLCFALTVLLSLALTVGIIKGRFGQGDYETGTKGTGKPRSGAAISTASLRVMIIAMVAVSAACSGAFGYY